MTKDEIILAQQARIEQLNTALNKFLDSHEECTDFDGFTAYIVSMDDFHDAQEEVGNKLDDLSALRAHDAAILREAAEYCKQQADEWDSDRVLTFKNYAGNCADELNARADAIEKSGV